MAGPARAGRGRGGADHARRHRGADKPATECVVPVGFRLGLDDGS